MKWSLSCAVDAKPALNKIRGLAEAILGRLTARAGRNALSDFCEAYDGFLLRARMLGWAAHDDALRASTDAAYQSVRHLLAAPVALPAVEPPPRQAGRWLHRVLEAAAALFLFRFR